MKQVILNKCYGGFGVSYKGYMEYAKEKGINLYAYNWLTNKLITDSSDNNTKETAYYSTKYLGSECDTIPSEFYLNLNDDEHREDIDLINVIKRLGKEANGRFANLVIVEIPDDMEYIIDDYDGFETLHQKVQEW